MPKKKLTATEEDIRRLYWDDGLGTIEIGAKFGVVAGAIASFMRRRGIPRRTKADAMRLSIERKPRTPRTTSQLRDVLRCRACNWSWKRAGSYLSEPCPRCGNAVDARMRKARNTDPAKFNEWRKENPERSRDIGRESRKRLRMTVLALVGRGAVRCCRCGCDRPECLEINHINGNGRKDLKASGGSQRFYLDIVQFKRVTDDLELCCRVCNSLHYLELKYGPLPYTVRWGADDDSKNTDGTRS